ncbi:LURP-one-related/scramblase family protein [Limosilactobacillus caecicola]|uniref:LURP-one-related/scramblase family protein n=1 Tax=Limosilactobacillus caecicola TaxID=2941332 RepID=UPI00203E3F4E|nr:hypothetical protein [Limosilactobacillus caecicola]
MRTLYLKNRANDRSATIIHDNLHEARYLLTGKWGLRHDALSLYTMQGDLLAEIKQLSLGMLPKFGIYVNHHRIATICKSLGFVREFIYIRDLNWVIMGNALNNHYRVFRNNHTVFTMEPEKSSGGLYCRLTINQESDEPVAILVGCVLNHWAGTRVTRRMKKLLPNRQFRRGAVPELGCYKKLD